MTGSCIYRYFIFLLLIVSLWACEAPRERPAKVPSDEKPAGNQPVDSSTQVYANQRFRNVTVEKIGKDKIKVKGEAQIFEATFSWVIEDGHHELKSGFQTTSAGAPEWGTFDFMIELPTQQANTSQHLILFESSAKDGSRQHELVIKIR